MSYKIKFEEFKDFWDEEPYLVLDTNVIFDLYRASSQTAEDVLKNFNAVIGNVWIPSQVRDEFYENQKEVKSSSYNKYTDVSQSVNNLIKKFNSELSGKFKRYGKFQFPKIHELRKIIETHTNSIETEAKEFRNKIKDEVEKNKSLLKSDPILKFISQLEQKEHVGKALSSKKLLEIYEEGEKRYAYQLPPGFEDMEKNKKDPTRAKQFGDLIIWKCILEKARCTESPIVFITEDGKPDWWHLNENKEIIEPRRELIAEFDEYTETNGNFLMLPLSEFIKHIAVINKLSSLHAEIEYNADEISEQTFKDKDSYAFETLQSELFHSGQLDSYLSGGLLSDLEIYEINLSTVAVDSVDFDETLASLEGKYELELGVDAEVSFSKNYSVSKHFAVKLTCDFLVELTLDFEQDEYDINDFSIRNPEIIEGNEKYGDDEFELENLCQECGRKKGEYELYSGGMVCDDCVSDSHLFTCTHCGIVYSVEEYNGDGERCQECK